MFAAAHGVEEFITERSRIVMDFVQRSTDAYDHAGQEWFSPGVLDGDVEQKTTWGSISWGIFFVRSSMPWPG